LLTSSIAKDGQCIVQAGLLEIVAVVCIVDVAQVVDSSDEGANEAEVDEGNEKGRPARRT
jgi:hypothetical protein